VSKIEFQTASDGSSKTTGVVLSDGTLIKAKKAIFSNATPEVTFKRLTSEGSSVFGDEFMNAVNQIDYTSPVTKINGPG
jgi:hypothetical protein